jgi:hypothetical protein
MIKLDLARDQLEALKDLLAEGRGGMPSNLSIDPYARCQIRR